MCLACHPITAGFTASSLRSYRNPPGIVTSLAHEKHAHVGDGGAASDSDKLTSGVPSPGRPTFKQPPAWSLALSNSVTLDKSMAYLYRK